MRRTDQMLELTRITGCMAMGCMIGILSAWLGINWITGCGEVTRTMDGTYIKGECVLVPWIDPNIYDHYVE
tara:strand:- start:250 stop:462 length:213 start_codon:yes stop_codon:yes gene_type:complete